MKVVLSLMNETLPKTLHCEEPSPHITWEGSGLQLLQKSRPWQSSDGRKRRAGVSSFGIGGTNVHLILEEAPKSESVPTSEESFHLPLVLSGKHADAVEEQAGRWAQWIESHPEASALDLVWTAAHGRSHFNQRAAVFGKNRDDILAALRMLEQGKAHPQVSTGEPQSGHLAFLFTGQGSQKPQMGQALMARYPVFRDAFLKAVAALDAHRSEPLLPILEDASGEALNQTVHATCALCL